MSLESGNSQQTPVSLEVNDRVAVVTLNRPEAMNSLNGPLLQQLTDAFRELNQRDDVQVIVLTGAGKAFSAGVDLKAVAEDSSFFEGNLGPETPAIKAMNSCRKPIIGAINGFAITGGFELALTCDFLYASEKAKFGDTHARVGLIPGWGLSQKLPRLVGINRAREISFSGNFVSAQQASDWGFVNAVYAPEELMPATLNIAQQIASTIPDALYQIKAMMNDGWDSTLGDGIIMEGKTSIAYNSKIDLDAMDERLAQLQARSRK